MSKVVPPFSLFHTSIQKREFTYDFDGDDEGVFNFMGTNFGAAGWSNPYTSGKLVIVAEDNNVELDFKDSIVDRIPSEYSTVPSPNKIVFDLGASRSLIIKRYSYRYRYNQNTYCPTAWTIEASNDGSDWSAVVDTQTGQTPVINAWVSPIITGETVYYRYFRISMTGNNNSATTFMSIGEFELYGNFKF